MVEAGEEAVEVRSDSSNSFDFVLSFAEKVDKIDVVV